MFLHRKADTISNYNDVAAGGAINGNNHIMEIKEKTPSHKEASICQIFGKWM